jgi:hypothetical protein
VIRFFSRKGLLNEKPAANLLSWKNSGFSVDNSVRILPHDDKARSGLSQYIARHPCSLKKIRYIKEKGTVLYLTQYNPALKDNIKLFPALDFIVPHHFVCFSGVARQNGEGGKTTRKESWRNSRVRSS